IVNPMTSFTLIRRSLFHFWRTNLAVILGVAVATAVIGGALIVGDSVRASLRQMTLDRLGRIDVALTGHRFCRQEVAENLKKRVDARTVAPALVFSGAMERSLPNVHRRAGQTTIHGFDKEAWPLVDHGDTACPTGNQVVLGSRTAQALAANVG